MDNDGVLRIARAPTDSADLLGALSKVDSNQIEIEEILSNGKKERY